MRSLANPVVGYVGAVLGVIAIASIAVFTLHGMAAKAHRHWDADIDRIIAQQQAKKLDTVAQAEIPNFNDAGPQVTALTRAAVEDDEDDLASSNEQGQIEEGPEPRQQEKQPAYRAPAGALYSGGLSHSAEIRRECRSHHTTTLLRPR